MKRVIFALILMLLLMCGCENSEVCEEGEYWKITKNTNGSNVIYDYIIYNNDGNILHESESKIKPQITIDDYSDICIYIGNSSGYTVQYVCPYSDSVSEVFENPLAWCDGDVAIIGENETGENVIIVHSSYSGQNSRSYELPLSTDISPEEAILGAAFDKYANNLTVVYISEDNKHCTAVLPINTLDWENNPIDRFYNKYTVETYSTPETSAAQMYEKEIWKAEFENAYQMLRGMANPKIDSIQTDIDASAKAFDEYVEAYSSVYMAYDWSSAFYNDGTEWSDELFYGTGASGAATECEAGLYRQATIDLYRMINDRFESVDEAFIFDEQEYLNFLRTESYLNVVNNENGEVFAFEDTVNNDEEYIFKLFKKDKVYELTYAKKNEPTEIIGTLTFESDIYSYYRLAHLTDIDCNGCKELVVCTGDGAGTCSYFDTYQWHYAEGKFKEIPFLSFETDHIAGLELYPELGQAVGCWRHFGNQYVLYQKQDGGYIAKRKIDSERETDENYNLKKVTFKISENREGEWTEIYSVTVETTEETYPDKSGSEIEQKLYNYLHYGTAESPEE